MLEAPLDAPGRDWGMGSSIVMRPQGAQVCWSGAKFMVGARFREAPRASPPTGISLTPTYSRDGLGTSRISDGNDRIS